MKQNKFFDQFFGAKLCFMLEHSGQLRQLIPFPTKIFADQCLFAAAAVDFAAAWRWKEMKKRQKLCLSRNRWNRSFARNEIEIERKICQILLHSEKKCWTNVLLFLSGSKFITEIKSSSLKKDLFHLHKGIMMLLITEKGVRTAQCRCWLWAPVT